MNCINRTVIRGTVVGEADIYRVGKASIARFAVRTERTMVTAGGRAVPEITYVYVTAWGDNSMMPLSELRNRLPVLVTGHLRNVTHTGADGTQHLGIEVKAETVERASEDDATDPDVALTEAVQDVTLAAWPVLNGDVARSVDSREALALCRGWAAEFERLWRRDGSVDGEDDYMLAVEAYAVRRASEYLRTL